MKSARCLTQTYGKKQARIWQQRWRIFFMACSELFGYSKGNEWRRSALSFYKVQLSDD